MMTHSFTVYSPKVSWAAAVPETVLGAADTEMSEAQSLLSSCFHSIANNMPATNDITK